VNRLPALRLVLVHVALLAASLREPKSVALLSVGPVLTFAWLNWRLPSWLGRWDTSSIALASSLAFSIFIDCTMALTTMGSTSGLGFAVWWVLSLALIPACIGIARMYQDGLHRAHA